jgi:PemK-like, MazF-like toxin of type II toxin-antitoxin system
MVVRCACLWHWEFEQGREEGDKNRPCAIILSAVDQAGETVVTVLPVTHTNPADKADAVELPRVVKQRLGLDDARSWVIVNEMNRFV